MNPDYDILMKQFYLYYDMTLVTLSIDENRNLIVQFPVYVEPYIQQQLILYQIGTVPVLIVDQNKHAQHYTHLQIERPYIALNCETYISYIHKNCQCVRK